MLNRRWFRVRLDAADIDKPPVFLGNVKQLDGTKTVERDIQNIDIHPQVSVQEISRVQKHLVSVRELAGIRK